MKAILMVIFHLINSKYIFLMISFSNIFFSLHYCKNTVYNTYNVLNMC